MFEKITALVWQTNSSSMTVLLISNESKEFKIQNSKFKIKIQNSVELSISFKTILWEETGEKM